MNRNLSALIVIVGIVAVIYVGVKLYGKQHAEQVEARQKEAFEASLVADEVLCDACGQLSKLDVPFKDRFSFQACPACGVKNARPIVYFYCMNPACDRRLIRFVGHVWDENGFNRSPVANAPVCPVCGQPNNVIGEPVNLTVAKQTAEETGQPFPPEE